MRKCQNQPGQGGLLPYRVLDLTDEKGLYCGKVLADFGADVIKIERPGGDRARTVGPFYHGTAHPEKSLFWFALNTNKKSITLDIETADGQDILKRLVRNADILIESFDPGYLEGLGLSYTELNKINPRLVMTSITPFGQTGPYSAFKTSDLVVLAMGCLLSQCGDPGSSPVRVAVSQSIMNAGSDAAEGTMIALYHQQLTGEGQHVDVSMQESCVWSTSETLSEWTIGGHCAKRPGHLYRRLTGQHVPILWECQDGYVAMFILGGQSGAKTNREMVRWMDSEGLAPDDLKNVAWEKWDWQYIKQEELDKLIAPIDKLFKSHTKAEIQMEAVARDIQIQPVFNPREIYEDPQLAARDFWINIEHDELNDTIAYPGPFVKFTDVPLENWRRAPLIGEHNDEIYARELGLGKDEIYALKEQGVI